MELMRSVQGRGGAESWWNLRTCGPVFACVNLSISIWH